MKITGKTDVVNAACATRARNLRRKTMKNVQLISLKKLLEIYPVSRATIYRQIKAGLLPAPVHIGTRRVAWRLDEIEQHIENLQKVQMAG